MRDRQEGSCVNSFSGLKEESPTPSALKGGI